MRNQRYFVDTNVFIRLIDSTNPEQHAQSKEFLQTSRENGWSLYTSDIVFSEISWLLKSFYKFTKVEILEVLNSLIALPHLKVLNNIDTPLAIDLFKKYNIKFVDAQIASICLTARVRPITIISFDTDFKKIKEVTALSPGELG